MRPGQTKAPDTEDTAREGAVPGGGVAAELDITADACPMTFVRTRIALDRLPVGALLRVRLRGEEPRRSVPRTAAQQGHEVVGVDEGPDGTTILLLRKGQRVR